MNPVSVGHSFTGSYSIVSSSDGTHDTYGSASVDVSSVGAGAQNEKDKEVLCFRVQKTEEGFVADLAGFDSYGVGASFVAATEDLKESLDVFYSSLEGHKERLSPHMQNQFALYKSYFGDERE